MYRSYLEVDLKAIDSNIAVINDISNFKKMMVILKGNAYSLGISKKLMNVFKKNNITHFGVFSLEEALDLRCYTDEKIFLMGHPFEEELESLILNDIVIAVSNIEMIDRIHDFSKKLKRNVEIMLNFDTGMGRLGMNLVELDRAILKVKKMSEKKSCSLKLNSCYTHYPMAYNKTHPVTKEQTKKIAYVRKQHPEIALHKSSTQGIIHMDNEDMEMIRPGVMVYGYGGKNIGLKPAVRLKSKVLIVRRLKKGNNIGYDALYSLEKDASIATIPVGFADGYNTKLSNKAFVNIKGKKYPVVGKVSMDYLTVNIGDDDVSAGDDVIVIGREAIDFEELASIMGTHVYELLCSVSKRVIRIHQ